MSSGPSIAVTGMAWTTALGDDLDAVWRRLLAAESGLAPQAHAGRLRSSLAAACPNVPLGLPATARMRTLAADTIARALADAGCDARAATLVLGTSLGASLEDEPAAAPLHAWADELAAAAGFREPPVVLSTACSAGHDALLVGAALLHSGAAERVVCGGVDVLTPCKRLAHSALGSMSATTLRAFDRRRDGTLLGEGAGFLVLELGLSGQRPRALLRGAGSANDAVGMTAPDDAGRGAQLALLRALADADAAPAEVGLVCAHGSGTPQGDRAEALALGAVFGGVLPPLVFATKGNFGHSLGATGALAAIALALALRTGRVPPIAGLDDPDPVMRLPLAVGRPHRVDVRLGVSLTLGFGGLDTAIVLEAPPGREVEL